MATIDYKQKIKDYMNSSEVDTLYKSMLNNLFPELAESEDKRIRKAIIKIIGNIDGGFQFEKYGILKKDVLAWLKKEANGNEREIPIPEPPLTIKHAKEVMGIKQNDAWSEEDERLRRKLIELIYAASYCDERENLSDWLKSLKDRYTWKPSDEQIQALEIAIRRGIKLGTWEEEALKSLKEQFFKLKKLRKE